MISIITGSLLISFLHALIPNHWLPVVAIGKKEGWTLGETIRITFIAGLAHVLSTIIIGVLLGLIGSELSNHLESFTHIIAPAIIILLGLYFIKQHYEHRHFHVQGSRLERKTKRSIITALSIAMFLSPCLEIEAYFLLAGAHGWYMMALLALLYGSITISGMLIWVRIVYKNLVRLDWHRWEHNAGMITGLVLIGTGIISFFII